MKGKYGRIKNFGNKEREVRRYYVEWLKKFEDIIGDIGGK